MSRRKSSAGAATVGRFRVTGVLGAGGFGTVYLGEDPADGSRVAVKVLDRDDPALRTRLRAEAAALRRLNDPHCVRVLDVVDQPDVAAIVTELVDGAPLRAVLDRAGRLTGPQACDVMRGALHGLAAVHTAGLLHGDLKPDNVLIDRRGVSRLIDFGLAAAPQSVRTRPVSVTGSPAYLSPEQIRGEPGDVRSDIYACAVILYELLCGRRPFAAGWPDAVLQQHLHAPVPDPRAVDAAVSPAFARLCMSGLAKDPSLRPQSAAEFLAALEDAARERYGAAWRTGLGLGALVGGVVAAGAGTAKAASFSTRSPRRVRMAAGSAVAAVVAVAVGVLVTAHPWHAPRDRAAAAPRIPTRSPSPAATSPAGPPGQLVVTRGARKAIRILSPDGTSVSTIAARPLCCYGPALSPDGKQLLFEAEGTVSVARADGSAEHMLWASPTLIVSAATWSPSGQQIAFSATDNSTAVPSSDLDVINADATAMRTVARGTNIDSIAWSPTGTQLAFLQNQGGIWLVPSSGGAVHNVLASARMLPRTVSWAPGDTLLFNEVGATPTGVWSVRPDGSGLRSVLPGAASPSWGPDGTHFAAILRGRVVIARASGSVIATIGPTGAATVQWGGPR